jgi:hypothetical protein
MDDPLGEIWSWIVVPIGPAISACQGVKWPILREAYRAELSKT